MKKVLVFSVLLVFVFSILALNSSQADAKARYGSFRVGGYNSHGKGSHYIGGYLQ